MTAIAAWKARVTDCRRARPEPDDAMWERVAPCYARWVQHNDYVEQVLPSALKLAPAGAMVLEIGPGTGAFTLPLARAGRRVTAVEPAAAMRAVLRQALTEAGLDGVRLVAGRIEEALATLDGAYDLALASHALYNVLAVDELIAWLLDRARHVLVLMGTGDAPAWQREVYRRFGIDAPPVPAHFGDFYRVLLEMGVYADVSILRTGANYVYESEDDLLDWWMGRLRLDDAARPRLREALAPHIERRDGAVGIYGCHRAALVHIDGVRSVFSR